MADEEGVVKKVASKKSTVRPTTAHLVVEAITALDDRKGVTVPAIKSFIQEKYPTIDPVSLRHHLKKALGKAMESQIVRPKNSEQTGPSLNGRYHLNNAKKVKPPTADEPKVKKVKLSEEEKTKKAEKLKAKKVSSKKTEASKKLVKAAKKIAMKTPDVKKRPTKSLLKINPKTPLKAGKKVKAKEPRPTKKETKTKAKK